MPPSAPKSACKVSPFCANTTRVNEPASTMWPGSRACACGPVLVAEPGAAERRMPKHAAAQAGLLDLGIAVHDAADPAQIDIERTDRPAADHDTRRGAIVGNRVENLARALQ